MLLFGICTKFWAVSHIAVSHHCCSSFPDTGATDEDVFAVDLGFFIQPLSLRLAKRLTGTELTYLSALSGAEIIR
mgnify:CR=1 FL=1